MSYADKVFVEMCEKIFDHGTNTSGQKVRPVWADSGESAFTTKVFGEVHKYDLRKEFPMLTLRFQSLKSAVNEIRWIYQLQSNNIKDLKPHIWDSWADADGSIGKAYGYQIGKKFIHHTASNTIYDITHGTGTYDDDTVKKAFEDAAKEYLSKHPEIDLDSQKQVGIKIPILMDQMSAVLYDLKHEPFGRRIMTNIFNHDDLHAMKLQPCCYSCTFNVTLEEGYDKPILNMILNQRSNDILAANGWNVMQYAALLMMVARDADMVPGELCHVIADAHIYDRHYGIVKELITREQYPAPKVYIREDAPKSFWDITEDDFVIEGYQYGPAIKGIDVAV